MGHSEDREHVALNDRRHNQIAIRCICIKYYSFEHFYQFDPDFIIVSVFYGECFISTKIGSTKKYCTKLDLLQKSIKMFETKKNRTLCDRMETQLRIHAPSDCQMVMAYLVEDSIEFAYKMICMHKLF